MTDAQVVDLATATMLIAAKLSAPILITALAIGLGVSLFQSVTQIQEATLSFVPKMIGVGIAIVLSGNWMLHEMIGFTNEMFARLPALLGGG